MDTICKLLLSYEVCYWLTSCNFCPFPFLNVTMPGSAVAWEDWIVNGWGEDKWLVLGPRWCNEMVTVSEMIA